MSARQCEQVYKIANRKAQKLGFLEENNLRIDQEETLYKSYKYQGSLHKPWSLVFALKNEFQRAK